MALSTEELTSIVADKGRDTQAVRSLKNPVEQKRIRQRGSKISEEFDPFADGGKVDIEEMASEPESFGSSHEGLADLGFDAERIAELQSHVKGAGKDHGAFGFSADTEHHFRELDDPTKKGSIEADMRKISKHLGYEHAGTLNHDRVRDWMLETDSEPVEEEELEITTSPRMSEAKALRESYKDHIMSGDRSEMIFGVNPVDGTTERGGLGEFVFNYKRKVADGLKPKPVDPNSIG